jgi:acetyl esterase
LHPQAQAVIDAELAAGLPPIHTLTGDEARARFKMRPHTAIPAGLDVRQEDRIVPAADGHAVPIRVYRPTSDTPSLPILVWFHGGGWVTGDLDSNDATCHLLAHHAGSVVVSVDYRLAPEHRFPTAVEDAYAATQWAATHATEFGADASLLAVGGASAGGNLAAAVALIARDREGPRLIHQLLVYPVTDRDFTRESYVENGAGFGLTRETMQWYWQQYLGDDEAAANNPYAAPLQCQDLTRLPRAHVLTAEYDPLRDEGEEYARCLEEQGVMTVMTRYPGMIHGFFGMVDRIDDSMKAITEAANQLRISVALTRSAVRAAE